ncbi:MAG TPA: D-aminoacyl-tRNA deacylase [Bacteroidales bacterium]
MRVVIQRVSQASVSVDNAIVSKIGKGILILLGIEETDGKEDIEWLAGKVTRLRIFDDESGVMNLSILDLSLEAIVVSQFTLLASTKKGNRPSYIKAALPEKAIPLYEDFVKELEMQLQKNVGTGIFGAMMQVDLTNDGPVTILIDSKNRE